MKALLFSRALGCSLERPEKKKKKEKAKKREKARKGENFDPTPQERKEWCSSVAFIQLIPPRDLKM